ncbi:ATP-dependent DNA helicase [Acidovorax sp. NCPPB 4044]|uniref:ATP-dependent DNA helicase n=1 Tax=Acidovorax sp. NCPPB 4044 TaxID=2940490 RepID=UPI0023029622|nr:ATP-dependent DNA helicase [Acidovorax sp. NCPPB 4044]MDA8520611.1 ATP-dependent DNA helicase [Acidovorax sp. NCPPB 4044]
MGTGAEHPSTLMQAVAAAFSEDGPLALAQPGFQPRPGQTEMATAVAETIEHGGALVVEAGTGVGKTFAYLVPALLSGERVLISTATKALQDQLFSRDLPRLVDALALPVRMALLKGRASYLCLHRMDIARQHPLAADTSVARMLARVEEWSQATATGDLAELPGWDERSAATPLFTSTRDNCLGSSCPRFRACHVHLARRDALAADVVVINHHLFFADHAIRDSGMAELLPSVRVVVFDEAHQLNDVGVQFMGIQLSSSQWMDLARDVLAAGQMLAPGLADWPGIADGLDQAAKNWRLAVGSWAPNTRLRWVGAAPEGVNAVAWTGAMLQLSTACRRTLAAVDMVSEIAPDFLRLHERCIRLMERIDVFSDPFGPDAVRWVEVGPHPLRAVQAPLDIAAPMRALWSPDAVGSRADGGSLNDAHDADPGLPWADEDSSSAAAALAAGPGTAAGRPRSWVFTSATLGDDASMGWFTASCGLEGARVMQVESPFDYAIQAALYVPRQLPAPSDPAHGTAVAHWVGDAIRVLGGRTLVLTTTLKALRTIGDALLARFPEGAGIEVLVQGDWPKRRLMERFREGDGEGSRAGCVLVASATFWEGFDVPGEALQLVVIDKLPFPPPGDPVVEARSQRLEHLGKSAFRHFALPEAAIALKQGAGRLIRSEHDRGLLTITDSRLVTMGYGKRLLAALPRMRRIESEEEWIESLGSLVTTPSTRAHPSP